MAKRAYIRLTQQIKGQLIYQVLFKGLKIKEAAKLLNINYNAAKLIIIHHRNVKANQKKKYGSANRCKISTISKSSTYQIVSKIGGFEVNSKLVHSS